MTNLTQHPIKVEKRQMSYLGIYLCQRQKIKRFYIQSILITSSKEQTKKGKLKNIFLVTMKTNFHLHMLR